MVEHLRPTERVGAVATPNRLRAVKRERHRQDRRNQNPDGKKSEQAPERPEEQDANAQAPAGKNESSTGQRINVVI